MRVASFNILHGQPVIGPREHAFAHTQEPPAGTDSARELKAAVKEINPTFIGMQEVDRNQDRSGLVDQTEAVAHELGARDWKFVPTVVGTPGGPSGFRSTTIAEQTTPPEAEPQYGIALISKLPVTSWHVRTFEPAPLWLPLLVQAEKRPKVLRVKDEQRSAIAAIVATPTGPMTIVTSHLSFVPGYNAKQLTRIRQWLRAFPRPLVLVGDFNLPSPIPARATKFAPVFKESTFPSYRPRVQFDHILTDGYSATELERIEASARRWSLGVSDHCAVSADLPDVTGLDSHTPTI